MIAVLFGKSSSTPVASQVSQQDAEFALRQRALNIVRRGQSAEWTPVFTPPSPKVEIRKSRLRQRHFVFQIDTTASARRTGLDQAVAH